MKGRSKGIQIEGDQRQLRQIEKKLKGMKSEMPKVLSRAANRTAVGARLALNKKMRQTYTVKSGKLKQNMAIKRATYSSPVAKITLIGKPQAASYFKYTKGGQGGAKLQIRRDRPLKAIGSSTGRKAFVAQMPSGHVGIYQRRKGEYMDKSPRLSKPNINKKTQHTEKLRQFFGPSSAKMAEIVFGGKKAYSAALEEETQKLFQKNLDAQIRYVLSKK